MRRTSRFLALLALSAGSLFASAGRGNTATRITAACEPCRRPVCVQLCGPQKPAFCEFDPDTGCSHCACNG